MSKEDKIINFEFTRPDVVLFLTDSRDVLSEYEKIIENYFNLVFKVQNTKLKYIDLNTAYSKDNILVPGEKGSLNSLKYIMPYSTNWKVICEDEHKNCLFQFYIYGQNNCCGSSTTSKTWISNSYRDKKLGTLLQYLKEDIARSAKHSLITCTDMFYHKPTDEEILNLESLQPYLPNTKVLLNTGWKVQKLFFNRNSKNIVGLFSKDLELNYNKQVTMKISLNEDTFNKIENPTIGCDPELFFRTKDTKEFIPSFYVMGGTKYKPTDITDEGHNIQCDNVMVEYGVPPSKTPEEFVKNNLLVQNYLKDKIAEPNNLELVIFPSAEFKEEHLTNKKAKEFGCDPDYNVWLGGKPNKVGQSVGGLRTAGGHIHVGYNNYNRITNSYIVKAMDLFVSVPLVIMEPDNRRKEMYGKAGAYREQPWGVEYRSTSNYIFSSPELMKWAFNQTLKAIEFINDPSKRSSLDYYDNKIQLTINNKSKVNAEFFVEKFGIQLLENKTVEA